MDMLATDLRQAFRFLTKSWGFTLVAVTALAVGIGANTTIFGFVNGLLLRPLEVPEPDRLARVDTGGTNLLPHLLYSDYEKYRDRNRSFVNLAMFHHGWVTPVRIGGGSEMIAVTPVSGNYFETLGVRAAKGRILTPQDDKPNAPSVVVLSHEGQRRYFAEDPEVVGRTIDHIAVAWVSGVLGLFGLLLGATGTYGLVSFSMYERRREIALRLALGGTRSTVVRLTTRQGMRWAAIGVLLGLAAFLVGTQFVRTFLRGVSPFDPVSFAGLAFLLLAVTYSACFVPAIRVCRSSPLVALRE